MKNAKVNLFLVPILILIANIGLTATTVNTQLPIRTPGNVDPRSEVPIETQQENNIAQRQKILRNADSLRNSRDINATGIPRSISPEELARRREAMEN